MGIGSKIKGFFGRVWNGAKKGYSKTKQFIRDKITPIYNKISPILKMIPQTAAISSVADSVIPKINNISDDLGTGLKQGVQMGMDKLKGMGVLR